MNPQRRIAEKAARQVAGPASLMCMEARHADAQHSALHADGPTVSMGQDKGVPQLDAFAKYAVAFPRISRSILTRASSARRRLISICSALTGLLSTP